MVNYTQRDENEMIFMELIDKGNRNEFREQFLELHPADQVEVFRAFDPDQREKLYEFLSPPEFAEIFEELEIREQKEYILELDQLYAVEMLNVMASDDVVDFFTQLPEETAQCYLKGMDNEEALEVKDLLAYPEETAGAIMTTEFISVKSTNTVSEVMRQLRQEGPDAETIYYIYVVDPSKRLVGVLSLRDLITSKLYEKIEDIMFINVISVPVDMDQEEVANLIKEYDFLAVPVINQEGKLVGIITVDDVIDVIEEETTEDFSEFSAVKGAVDLDISSMEAARLRLPWLLLLLFIGMFTAGLIGRFETTLESVAMLAFFIPLIAGMAGNIGTQSLAVVVRGIALGKIDRETVFRLLKRETLTGFLIGTVCGIVVAIISQVLTGGNLIMGFVIGVSLFCTLIVACLLGTIVPLVINHLKIDPAVASGPFITTINDIVGLFIYFTIATALLQYLK